MKMNRIFFPVVATLLFAFSASAEFSPKYPCSDSMVLQQNTDALVWGHGDAGKKVNVKTSWDGAAYTATVAPDGVWRVYVKTPGASYNHYEITARCGKESFTIHDVLVGEVWVASGQSNMEMPIRGFYNCPVENANHHLVNPAGADRVRMFTVCIHHSDEPVADVVQTRGWEKAAVGGISDMSATAYFFAEQLTRSLDVPVGILALPRGGARVESWLPRATVEKFGEDCSPEAVAARNEYTRPFQVYNGMEQPVKGYTARGFIWYQGCSNVGEDGVFVTRMTELVRQWREDWGDKDNSMPFYQVEIAPYNYGGGQEAQSPALRAAQHEAAKVIPNSGIICTNDLVYPYEWYNIHPCRKQPVGQRLAYMALNRAYGIGTVACNSPEALSIARNAEDASMLLVWFSNCYSGIDREQGVEALEVAGADGVFHPVTSVYMDWKESVLQIKCPEVDYPVTVRYGWGDFRPGNLHSSVGLPFVPFCLSVE